jgi:UDP-N-acetylmuramoyl-tripeptide--D-alanyl-D-alanine ligase
MNPPATIHDIAAAIGAECAGAPERPVAAVSTDTRTLRPGDVFVALKGERFDGHRFAEAAAKAGAAALIVEDPVELPADCETAVLRMDDTLLALQRLALWHRNRLDLVAVGITGSNGKTSTKDFAAAVLGEKFRVTATRGNFNNHIGLPLSVLAATAEDEVGIWEMGMNHAGELAPLCQIAKPKIGIITNIGTAHIEFLGSVQGIAEEKSALARALPADGTLVMPAGCEFFEYFRQRTKGKPLPVGNGRGVVRAEHLRFHDGSATFRLAIDGDESAEVRLPVDGRHMVNNALLAAGVGVALGLDSATIAVGLAKAKLAGGRLTRIQRRGVEIIDDSYNANPESMAAALETLAETPASNGAQRIAVLGFMGELGNFAEEAHRNIGKFAAGHGLRVAAVGEAAHGIAEGVAETAGRAEFFPNRDGAAEWLAANAAPGDVVLFKGSRAAGIEKVLELAFPEETD